MRALQIAAMAAFISAASVGFAQTSSTDPATPSRAASSTEAQTQSPSDTSPAAASSPHQRQATSDGAAGKQTMKECVAKQKASNSGMSSADAHKACKQEMKTNSGH